MKSKLIRPKDYRLTFEEAQKVGKQAARKEIDRYNREELPNIKASYAKAFILACHYSLGLGEIRMKRVLDALTELTCDMHNLIIDGVFNDVFDKRLKECGLWDVYEDWCNQACKPMSEGSKYVEAETDDKF